MKLSVIIPAYNAEKYINRCVDSVERAIHNIDSEVIIIDDGSQDRTSEVCHELALRYANIRTITMNDDGVSAARNRGMELACGKYISFVDADDIVSSDMFTRLISEAEENDADIVGCEFFQWTDETYDSVIQGMDDAAIEANSSGTISKTYTPSQYITEEILKGNSRCWSKIYRAAMLKNADVKFLPGLTIGEDMLFVVQATKATGPKAKASDTETKASSETAKTVAGTTKASSKIIELKNYQGYGYYTNPKGAINRPFTPQYMDQIKCWELVEEEVAGELTSASASNDVACAASLSSLHTKTIMAIMLVASKIATTQGLENIENIETNVDKESIENKEADRDNKNSSIKDTKYNAYITVCKTKLDEIINKDKVAYRNLDIGYKIKVTIFRLSPALYLKMYGAWKK